MKRSILIIILSVCFLCSVFWVLCITFLPLKGDIIPVDRKWYGSVNNICIESYYDNDLQDTNLSGTMLINNDIVDLEIGIRASTIFFSCEEISFIMIAQYKLKKNGDIELYNITYSEEINWQSTPKKIILKNNTGSDPMA